MEMGEKKRKFNNSIAKFKNVYVSMQKKTSKNE